MSESINKVIAKLSGFMFGYSTGVMHQLKQNQSIPVGVDVTPIGNFNVYTRTLKYGEDTHIVFQFGKQCVQTGMDSFIAKNVISLIIGSSPKITSTKMPGKSIPIVLGEMTIDAFNDVVILFKDDIIAGIE